MAETEIHERLARVLVRFDGGRMDPLAFRWGTRDLKVRSVNARWTDRTTRPFTRYFSTTLCSEEVVVLSWREGDGLWHLESVLGGP
jgi:hypothetical protein